MKEPELEEEALDAEARGSDLLVTRQTIGEAPGPATVLTPSGQAVSVPMVEVGAGRYEGVLETDELGLFQAANGDLRALANVGPVNPREYREAISTTEKLKPITDATRGSVRRLAGASGDIDVPRIVPVTGRADADGRAWIGLRKTEETVLRGVDRTPLFAGFLGLAVLLLALSATWYREGR